MIDHLDGRRTARASLSHSTLVARPAAIYDADPRFSRFMLYGRYRRANRYLSEHRGARPKREEKAATISSSQARKTERQTKAEPHPSFDMLAVPTTSTGFIYSTYLTVPEVMEFFFSSSSSYWV